MGQYPSIYGILKKKLAINLLMLLISTVVWLPVVVIVNSVAQLAQKHLAVHEIGLHVCMIL
jgi:hypothetical protein